MLPSTSISELNSLLPFFASLPSFSPLYLLSPAFLLFIIFIFIFFPNSTSQTLNQILDPFFLFLCSSIKIFPPIFPIYLFLFFFFHFPIFPNPFDPFFFFLLFPSKTRSSVRVGSLHVRLTCSAVWADHAAIEAVAASILVYEAAVFSSRWGLSPVRSWPSPTHWSSNWWGHHC